MNISILIGGHKVDKTQGKYILSTSSILSVHFFTIQIDM